MARKLVESERKLLANAELSMKAEAYITQKWSETDEPKDASWIIKGVMSIYIPSMAAIYAIRAAQPELLPHGLYNVANLLLILLLLMFMALTFLQSIISAHDPLSIAGIASLSKKKSWKTGIYRFLWAVLIVSNAWVGKIVICLCVIGIYLGGNLLLKLSKVKVEEAVKKIDDDPSPVTIKVT